MARTHHVLSCLVKVRTGEVMPGQALDKSSKVKIRSRSGQVNSRSDQVRLDQGQVTSGQAKSMSGQGKDR